MLLSVTSTSPRVNVRNPVSFTVIVYVPDWTVGKRYAPVASVATSRDAPVSRCVIVTIAPGIAAPVSSVTLPTREPYNTCALSPGGEAHTATRARMTTITSEDERTGATGIGSRGLELVMAGSPLNITDSDTRGTGL